MMSRFLILISLFLFACEAPKDKIEEAKDKNNVVLVDFWGEGCKPCRMIEPYIAEIKEEYPQVSVLNIDINSDKDLLSDYQINRIPTVIVFSGGEECMRLIGYHEKVEYVEAVEMALDYVNASGNISKPYSTPVWKEGEQSCPIK